MTDPWISIYCRSEMELIVHFLCIIEMNRIWLSHRLSCDFIDFSRFFETKFTPFLIIIIVIERDIVKYTHPNARKKGSRFI